VSASSPAPALSRFLGAGLHLSQPSHFRGPVQAILRARRFNATLADGEGIPFAILAQREGVSRSYFTRLVRLSYLAPDITQAILDGRQPRDLTAQKLVEHSRLPLAWHDQRTVLGFA
jgi:site-specific DNA recombinase